MMEENGEWMSEDEEKNPDNLIFSRDEDDIVNFIDDERVHFDNTDDEEEEDLRNDTEGIEVVEKPMEESQNIPEEDVEVNEPFQEYTGGINISRTARNRVHPFLLGSNNGTKLRMIISELQVMIDESRLELDDLKMEYKSTKRSLLEEQAKCLHLEQQMEHLRDIEDFKNTNQIEDLRGEKLDRAVKELESHKERNKELIKERNEIEKKYLRILKHKKFTIKSSETEIVRLTTQLTEANTLLETRMMKIEQLKDKQSESEKEYHKSLENARLAIQKKRNQITELSEVNRTTQVGKERFDRVQETNKKLLKDMDKLRQANARLKKELQSKQMHIGDLEGQVNEVRGNIDDMSSNKYFYEGEITKLKEDLVKERSEKERVKQIVRKLKSRIREKDSELSEQNTIEMETLKLEIVELKQKNGEIERKNHHQLNSSLNNLRKEQKEHIQNICKKLLVEKKEIRQEIDRTKKQLGKEKKKFEKVSGQLNESKKIIKSLEETIKLEESKSSSLLLELNQEKERSISVESKFLNQSQVKSEQLKKKIRSLQTKNERLEREVEEIRENRSYAQEEQIGKMKVLVGKYNKQKEWIRRARQREEDRNSKIQFLEIEFNRLTKTVKLKEKQIKHLQNLLNMLKEEDAISKAK